MYFLLFGCLAFPITGQQGAIENIKTLCLEVKEIYPDIGEDFSLNLEGKIRQFFSGMGKKILSPGETVDANFKVLFTGKAQKLEFTSGSNKIMNCYAQGEYKIEMTLTFTEAENNYKSESIDNFTSRLIAEDNCSQDAKKAPFDQAWQNGFLRGLSEIWPSSQVYANALMTEDRRFHIPAVMFYMSNRPTPEAVIGLMQLLKSAFEEKSPQAVTVGSTIVNPQSSWDRSFIIVNGSPPYKNLGPEAAVAVPDLCKFLQDSCISIRPLSAQVLGQIGSAAIEAVPFLINALKEDETKQDRNKAFLNALKKITGQNLGKQSDRWLQWWEEYKNKK